MAFKINSLTVKLFCICLVFVFGTVFIVFQLSYRLIEREVHANNEFFIEQMKSKVDQYISLSFTSLETILFALESSYSNEEQGMEEIMPVLRKLYDMNSNMVGNVYLIHEDASLTGGSPRSILFDEPNSKRREVFEQAFQNRLSVYVSPPYLTKQQVWTVTMAKSVAGSNPPKVAALDIDLQSLEQSLLNINRSDLLSFAIVDANGKLVAGNIGVVADLNQSDHSFTIGAVTSSQLVSRSDITGVIRTGGQEGDWHYRKYPGSRFNWTILTFNTDKLLQQSLKRIEKYYLGLLAIGLVLSALTAAFITRYIRQPLAFLMRKMLLIKQGFFGIPVVLNRKDEFGELSRAFDLMLKQIEELLEQVKRSHELQREQELEVLQSQINPHFLYNTLGSISNAVNLGYLDKVDPIIRSLIRILEYGVANVSQRVPLSDELANVREYLFIQNARSKTWYRLIEDIEQGLESFPVFRLLLQPIVENSVFHGYSGGRKPGDILIRAYRSDQQVIIEIKDSGCGIAGDQVERLLQPKAAREQSARKRIGLVNIHQRIALYNGDMYGLSIESEPGAGTCVRAVFPLMGEGFER